MIILKLIAALFVFPPIVTYIVFRVLRRPFGNRRRAVHFAADWTAIFYIVACTYILSNLIGHPTGGYMLIILLAGLAFLLIWQYRTAKEVVLYKLLKQFMRCAFLIFFCLYFLLAVIWIVSRII